MDNLDKLSVDNFRKALRKLQFSDFQKRMIQIHYNQKNQIITAKKLANEMGWQSLGNANMHYGKIGRLIEQEIGFNNPEHEHLFTIVTFSKESNGWHWILRKEFVQALIEENIVIPKEETDYDDDLKNEDLPEGAKFRIIVNKYERNIKAREESIKYYGAKCIACSFDFKKVYGNIAADFIHVHHIVPIASVGKEYVVNPVKDLVPLCPNCHAVVHLSSPPLTIDELKTLIRKDEDS